MSVRVLDVFFVFLLGFFGSCSLSRGLNLAVMVIVTHSHLSRCVDVWFTLRMTTGQLICIFGVRKAPSMYVFVSIAFKLSFPAFVLYVFNRECKAAAAGNSDYTEWVALLHISICFWSSGIFHLRKHYKGLWKILFYSLYTILQKIQRII